MIRSVLGRIDPARLGITLLHAHSTDDPQVAVAELREFAMAGGNTVIQARTSALDEVRLAEASGVNVVPLTHPLIYVQPADSCQAFLEMDRLQATGMDLRNLAVHPADEKLADLEVLCGIVVRGAWLAIETRDPAWHGPLKRLIEAGWAGQLLVATCLCGTLDAAIKALRKAGFLDDVVDGLLVRNPLGYLAANRS